MKNQYYKFNKTYNDSSIICEGSVLVITEKQIFKKNGSLSGVKEEIFCQGQDSLIPKMKFKSILDSGSLDKIDESDDLIAYVNDYVIEPIEFKNRKKILSDAKRQIPQYESVISTISTWVFSTKGSPASTISAEKEFQSNPDKFLNETKFRGGMKAKPGSPFKNRGTRQTVVSDVDKWENDEKSLLPNGIRMSDSCTYLENVKIFDKVITEIISIYDCPEEFYKFFINKGYVPKLKSHVDYLYKTTISWELFKQNTHHAKVKGLEFCHINPEIEFTTFADNITIGTSESNRHQGGYSVDFTLRKLLISEIYDFISNDDNYLTLQSELDKLSKNDLIFKLVELKVN
jgi:hypothetical protein